MTVVLIALYVLVWAAAIVPYARFLWRAYGDGPDAVLATVDAPWTRAYSLFLSVISLSVWPLVALGFVAGWAVPRIVDRAVPGDDNDGPSRADDGTTGQNGGRS